MSDDIEQDQPTPGVDVTNRNPFFDEEQQEQVRQMAARLGEQAQAAAVAMAEAFRPAIQQVIDAARPLIELANSPQGQALIAAHEARVAAGLYGTEACHCLCGKNHPGRSICRGEVPPRDVQTLRYRTDVGLVEVPMCPPCAQATLMAVTA